MATPISLGQVAGSLEMVDQNTRSYLHRETGEIVTVLRESLAIAEEDDDDEEYPEWQQADIEAARAIVSSDDWLPLPDESDIDEYRIMERYCTTVDDPKAQDLLFDSIRGRGAFRRFKDTIHQFGLTDDWYAYRARTIIEIARGWLEEEGIPYVDDVHADT